MKKEYQVPALIKVDSILRMVTKHKGSLRLIDISKELGISKSSCFNLLRTLEQLKWLVKDDQDEYKLGPVLGQYGHHYFKDLEIINIFQIEAKKSLSIIDEHIQLGVSQGNQVMYLAKIKGSSTFDLVTYPGVLFPSHSTSVGKIQLINKTYDELEKLFPDGLESVTPYTITNLNELFENLQEAKVRGYIEEHQESAVGFHCVACPIYNADGEIIAGVSTAMLTDKWEIKHEIAREEIIKLSQRISYLNGYESKIDHIV
ncbi:IclR family transcriptional regulator [Ureibacillus composti]